MRRRKPWVLRRLRTFGCHVRFGILLSSKNQYSEAYCFTDLCPNIQRKLYDKGEIGCAALGESSADTAISSTSNQSVWNQMTIINGLLYVVQIRTVKSCRSIGLSTPEVAFRLIMGAGYKRERIAVIRHNSGNARQTQNGG